ncbi:hypothetical protein LPJ76_002084, partial [Coemansia sp. RSA 638]
SALAPAAQQASTPSLVRRGSAHHPEYFLILLATTTAPRRISQRPRSVLLSPRRSMEDHHMAGMALGADSESLFDPKSSEPLRSIHNAK